MMNREYLVNRHNPVNTRMDPNSPLSVGNGEFAFTADITGMQTFPQAYREGIPLCTQSQWGWHIKPGSGEQESFTRKDLRLEMFEACGRKVGYTTSPEGQEEAFNWLRENPHRLHLGSIGFEMKKQDNTAYAIKDLQDMHQTLDMWKGLMESCFTVEGHCVETQTCCHPQLDMVAFKIRSEFLSSGRMNVRIAFPYGTADKTAADWRNDSGHSTTVVKSGEGFAHLHRVMDREQYTVKLFFSKNARLERTGENNFLLKPSTDEIVLELSCLFQKESSAVAIPSFSDTRRVCKEHWQEYWNNGAMVEFQGSTDKRANELERRVVLSQYLMAIQCAGSLPPQETGLTFNSWYGKFHLEMHWWHGVHFPLWGRPGLFEKSMGWYKAILPQAKELAASQGYMGARWPKMVAYDGSDSPSGIGPLLIWQQPHPIYYAELLYRTHPNRETLEAYREIVFETAEFMASYAAYDEEGERYVLGPPLIPAQENHQPQITMNPTYELEYWAFGLSAGNEWRKRLGLEPDQKWGGVLKALAELPVLDGAYLAHENCADTYTRFNQDHPSMLGALGILPGTKVNPEIMRTTLKRVLEQWDMESVWGWDFPMIAMTAARLGEPELAVDALLYDAPKNEYLINGHNKQADRQDLPIYLPGNGGLLTAVAMMSAGWYGCNIQTPGFPQDGTWKVTWEGLQPML